MKGNRTKSGSMRGILGKLDDVILGDIMGEMGWMLVLVLAVLAVIGLIYLFSLGA